MTQLLRVEKLLYLSYTMKSPICFSNCIEDMVSPRQFRVKHYTKNIHNWFALDCDAVYNDRYIPGVVDETDIILCYHYLP